MLLLDGSRNWDYLDSLSESGIFNSSSSSLNPLALFNYYLSVYKSILEALSSKCGKNYFYKCISFKENLLICTGLISYIGLSFSSYFKNLLTIFMSGEYITPSFSSSITVNGYIFFYSCYYYSSPFSFFPFVTSFVLRHSEERISLPKFWRVFVESVTPLVSS